MRRVGPTNKLEDKLITRSDDHGVRHALLPASQAGVGTPNLLRAIEPEVSFVHV